MSPKLRIEWHHRKWRRRTFERRLLKSFWLLSQNTHSERPTRAFGKGEFPCRPFVHQILVNSGSEVFACSESTSRCPTTFWWCVRMWRVVDTSCQILMRPLRILNPTNDGRHGIDDRIQEEKEEEDEVLVGGSTFAKMGSGYIAFSKQCGLPFKFMCLPTLSLCTNNAISYSSMYITNTHVTWIKKKQSILSFKCYSNVQLQMVTHVNQTKQYSWHI